MTNAAPMTTARVVPFAGSGQHTNRALADKKHTPASANAHANAVASDTPSGAFEYARTHASKTIAAPRDSVVVSLSLAAPASPHPNARAVATVTASDANVPVTTRIATIHITALANARFALDGVHASTYATLPAALNALAVAAADEYPLARADAAHSAHTGANPASAP